MSQNMNWYILLMTMRYEEAWMTMLVCKPNDKNDVLLMQIVLRWHTWLNLWLKVWLKPCRCCCCCCCKSFCWRSLVCFCLSFCRCLCWYKRVCLTLNAGLFVPGCKTGVLLCNAVASGPGIHAFARFISLLLNACWNINIFHEKLCLNEYVA